MDDPASDMIFCLEFLQQANSEFPNQAALARALHGAQLMEAALDNLTTLLRSLPEETQVQIEHDMRKIFVNQSRKMH